MWRAMSKEVLHHEIKHLNTYLRGEMITNHAGEIGAVYMYYGARHSLLWRQYLIRNPCVDIACLSSFVDHHLESEKLHLLFFKEIMPPELQTNLIPIWMVSGYFLGYISMTVSPHLFYKTIEYVEEFVVAHYSKQIKTMQNHNVQNLQKILQSFCDDEDEHRRQGLSNAMRLAPTQYLMWRNVVQSGSVRATIIAKYCKGYKI
eukprot:875508_1